MTREDPRGKLPAKTIASLFREVQRSGCAVEVGGVRMHPCDSYGRDLTGQTVDLAATQRAFANAVTVHLERPAPHPIVAFCVNHRDALEHLVQFALPGTGTRALLEQLVILIDAAKAVGVPGIRPSSGLADAEVTR